LFFRQRVPASVREEAIDDSGDMPHMKGCRSDASRPGIPLCPRQRLDNLADTLAHLQKNVRDWLEDIRDTVDGTALPPLRIRHLP
jgi:hypothetical protein